MGIDLRGADRWTRLFVVTWGLVGLGLILTAVFWLLGKVSGALVPFALALALVYIFQRPVNSLEARGWNRGLAVGFCYFVGLVVLVIAGWFIVPPVAAQLSEFFGAFPGYYDSAYNALLDLQSQYQALTLPAWAEQALLNIRDGVTSQFMSWSSLLAREAFTVGGQALGFLLNVFLAFVVGFWILKDMSIIKEEFVALAGPKRREDASEVASRVSRVLSGYMRGQLIISAATATVVAIGLSIIGVPYALVLGLIAGILNIVPYVGPFLSYIISAIVAVFVSPTTAVLAVVIGVAAQQVTDMFITPRVMSEQVDLHPLLVIFSLLAGSALFGFIGLLVAIPVAAVAKGLFVYYFEKYTDSQLASEGGAFFRRQPERRQSARPAAMSEPAKTDEPEETE
ncbi:MAG: AI-2E family transporter [Coriobacteriia bacterium]|nr:AI-2E family transporter [Coriobacteriia bacterium]MBN2823553.1 AI-2E family transporter [Coriobacteriia bacterium]